MTLMTMTKRGKVKARTGMRTQDPRLAQHCDLGSAFTELAAKGRRKARLLSARDALQSDPQSPEERKDDGALRRNTESQGPQQPVEADKRKPLSPYYNDVLDAVQPRVIS